MINVPGWDSRLQQVLEALHAMGVHATHLFEVRSTAHSGCQQQL